MNGDPWLTVGIALIAAMAALAGAAIAAWTAARRQATQLRHDADRQKRELAHDRALVDLAELRSVLDEAARDIASAERAMLDAHQAWAEDGAVSDAVRSRMREATDAMWSSAQRLGIRLGSDNVTGAYWHATHAHLESQGLVTRDGVSTEDRHQRSKSAQQMQKQFLLARDAFFEAANRIAGSRLEPADEDTSGTGG